MDKPEVDGINHYRSGLSAKDYPPCLSMDTLFHRGAINLIALIINLGKTCQLVLRRVCENTLANAAILWLYCFQQLYTPPQKENCFISGRTEDFVS